MTPSPIYDLTLSLALTTGRTLFITGKAGTGKTTLLRRIVADTAKRTVVVAPTGVAAINAGGATIHSFCQLPFGPLLPTREGRADMFGRMKINETRANLFRELELLIIDEISMVRADLLDAVDATLRHFRHRPDEPFGGVQLIMFGDMYQLPPVLKGEEQTLLAPYYPRPYFFYAQVMQQMPPILIELDTIFRQTDIDFITLLNELRNNRVSPASLELLHRRYRPDFSPERNPDYIILTTHNHKADSVNNRQMALLKAKEHSYQARIDGDFPASSYPADETLTLKVGARVMFIINDHSGQHQYYNGMMGRVTAADDKSVTVRTDSDTFIDVSPEAWENRTYTLNHDTNQIETELRGTFHQLPLRPAWAITIHKSQGLTFDHVAIDSDAAFAPGQVYVAFSRCRTLEGIVLTSPVNTAVLAVDADIPQYCQGAIPEQTLAAMLASEQDKYRRHVMARLFDAAPLYAAALDFRAFSRTSGRSFRPALPAFADSVADALSELTTVSLSFARQLQSIPTDQIAARVSAAAAYYTPRLTQIAQKLADARFATDSRANAKKYAKHITTLHKAVDLALFIINAVADNPTTEAYFDARARYDAKPLAVKAYSADLSAHELDDIDLDQIDLNADLDADELTATGAKRNTAKAKTATGRQANAALFARLAAWRTAYCAEHNIPAYMMFPTQTLREIATALPSSINDLRRVKGFGKVKIAMYGEECIEIVRQYCREKGLKYQASLDDELNDEPTGADVSTPREPKAVKAATRKQAKEPGADPVLELINQGCTPEQVAIKLDMRLSRVNSRIADLVGQGLLQAGQFLDANLLNLLSRLIRRDPEATDRALAKRFQGAVSPEMVKIARAEVNRTDSKQ